MPGIDEGAILAITMLAGPPDGVSFVVWSDTSGTGGGGGGSAAGADYDGELRADDGRPVTISAQTSDGITGTIAIDDTTYDIGQGALFLISTQNGTTTVKQIEFDVTDFPTETEELPRVADENAEIGEFFRGAVETHPVRPESPDHAGT